MKKKVLIVDDSITSAKQLQKVVDESGAFEVVGHAKNGIEGIKLYTTLKPDIVCMDLNMPEMDGLQAIRILINTDKNVKILVISSVGGVGEKVMEAIKHGAKNVLTKPFESEKIIEMLNKI
ncbi:MAG: two-component system response regulator [Thermodesulfovibrio sp. RBG_19FT_COMBO_42_12]|nr:MAG: two-component system response regulator [Thermodesulfovibrio sp. RBG_19FT_COMBO_42_12]